MNLCSFLKVKNKIFEGNIFLTESDPCHPHAVGPEQLLSVGETTTLH